MLHEVLRLLEEVPQEDAHLALLDLVELMDGILRTDDLVHEAATRAMPGAVGEEDCRTRPADEVAAEGHDRSVRVDSAASIKEVRRDLWRVDDDHRLPEDGDRADIAWDS